MTVVFPADDEMTVVCQGPFGADRRPEPSMWRGVKRMLTTPSYESAHYTKYYDAELAAKALQPYAGPPSASSASTSSLLRSATSS